MMALQTLNSPGASSWSLRSESSCTNIRCSTSRQSSSLTTSVNRIREPTNTATRIKQMPRTTSCTNTAVLPLHDAHMLQLVPHHNLHQFPELHLGLKAQNSLALAGIPQQCIDFRRPRQALVVIDVIF